MDSTAGSITTSVLSKYFGINTWSGPRERHSPWTLPQNRTLAASGVLAHTTRQIKNGAGRPQTSSRTIPGAQMPATNFFDRVPNEVFEQIVSDFIGPKVLLHEGYDPALRSIGCLRLVSRRFKDTTDNLLAKGFPSLDFVHLGGIPTTHLAQMRDMYQVYRMDLWRRLAPSMSRGTSVKVCIHFYPCMNQADAVNWLRDEDFRATVSREANKSIDATPRKDGRIAQNAMTDHHAAVVMLARIMRDLVLRASPSERKMETVLVFHEVDGTMFDPSRVSGCWSRPDFLPFWDAEGLRAILHEWRRTTSAFQVHFPNIAWATTFQANEATAWMACKETILLAWEPMLRLHEESLLSIRNIQIPGSPRPTQLPANRAYNTWLTKADTIPPLRFHSFVVQGLQLRCWDDNRFSLTCSAKVQQPHKALLLQQSAANCLRGR